MNKNKKQIKILLFIFLFILTSTFLFIEFFTLYYTNVNNARWWHLKKVLEKEYDISDSVVKKLFIGDSRINVGIDFCQVTNSWAFGLGGGTTIENYFLLKKYLENYPKPDTIYISISPRLMSNLFAFWDLAVKNDFFTFEEVKEIIEYSKLQNDTTFTTFSYFKYFTYQINYISYYQEDIRNNLLFFGKQKNLNLIDFIMKNRGKRPYPGLLDSCSELNFETTMNFFNPNPVFEYYFIKTLEICKEKNIKTYFFSMPMNETSFKKLNPNFIKDYQNYIRKKQIQYPEFVFSDSLYFYPDSFFGDASHLNEKGMYKFTDYFLKTY